MKWPDKTKQRNQEHDADKGSHHEPNKRVEPKKVAEAYDLSVSFERYQPMEHLATAFPFRVIGSNKK